MPKVVLFLVVVLAARAQTLRGVIDLHVHCDPDSVPRSIDGISLAKLARSRGMRAIVLKNHYESTASLAWVARQAAPGIDVYGGIALNRAVGGINPAAVEYMARVKGGFGRFVWMPTSDAHLIAISKDGRLLPEVLQVLDLIAKHRLVLATGHSSPEDTLLLIKAARARGIRRIVVTHPMLPSIGMTVDQMKRAAVMGAFIEFDYTGLLGTNRADAIRGHAAAIRACGTAHVIVASDLGQPDNPLPPDGLLAFYRILRQQGFTTAEVERMARRNPAKLLLRY
jgi:hypothetical protein